FAFLTSLRTYASAGSDATPLTGLPDEEAPKNRIVHQQVRAKHDLFGRAGGLVDRHPHRIRQRVPVQFQNGIVGRALDPSGWSVDPVVVQLALDDQEVVLLGGGDTL